MRSVLLEELSVGSLVRHVPSPSCADGPWRVVSLSSDGTLFLVSLSGDDSLRCSIGDVYGIPIDGVLLSHLGFLRAYKDNVWFGVFGGVRVTLSLRQRHGEEYCRRVALTGRVTCWNESILYLHEFQRWWVDKVMLVCGVPLVLPLRVSSDGSCLDV